MNQLIDHLCGLSQDPFSEEWWATAATAIKKYADLGGEAEAKRVEAMLDLIQLNFDAGQTPEEVLLGLKDLKSYSS